MPWIKIIPESEARGELKEVYEKLRAQRQGEKINQDRDAGAEGPPVSPPPSLPSPGASLPQLTPDALQAHAAAFPPAGSPPRR